MYSSDPQRIQFSVEGENLAVMPSHFSRGADTVSAEGTLQTMKQVSDLPLWPVWVNPEHLVRTALILMRGHGVSGLGVIEGKKFVGVLYIEDLAGVPDDTPVSAYVRKDVEPVTASSSLRRVAEMMVGRNLPRFPVLEEGKFLGIVSAQDLLKDIGRNYDPLTQLPWSDALREWGMRNLEKGNEITILFFDLDDFGRFNKQYGHLVGDQVLRRVADALSSKVATATDLLCRYGGDEFVIGTLRSRAESEALAQEIVSCVNGLEVERAAMPITISHGVFGGRRTKERPGAHIAATLDDLINQASKECMARKAARVAPPETAGETLDLRQVELVSAVASPSNGGFRGIVVLSAGERLLTGVVPMATSAARAGAFAVAAALNEALAERCQVLDVIESDSGAGSIMTVVGMRGNRAIAASRLVTGNPAEDAAKIALDGFNA